jgi:hypothetical protein
LLSGSHGGLIGTEMQLCPWTSPIPSSLCSPQLL